MQKDFSIKTKQILNTFNLAMFFEIACAIFGQWFYLMAGIFIVIKLMGLQGTIELNYLLMSIILALGWVIHKYHNSKYSKDDAICWLDLNEEAGGRYLAKINDEKQDVVVSKKTVEADANLTSYLQRLTMPSLVFLVAFIMPGIESTIKPSAKSVRRKLQMTEKNIDKVDEHQIVNEKRIEELQQAIEKINAIADDRPESAMEGVDHLQRSIEEDVIERAKEDLKNLQIARQLLASLTAKGQDKETIPDKENLKNLANSLNNELKNGLESPDLEKALQSLGFSANSSLNSQTLAGLSEKELKKLAKALRKCSVKRLSNCKSCKSCMSSLASKEKLKKMLSGVGKLSSLGDLMAKTKGTKGCKRYGKGGIDRGRGDAPLQFGDEKKANNPKFKPIVMGGNDEFIPGVILKRQAFEVEKMPPPEFSLSKRSGIKVKGKIISEQSSVALGPERMTIAKKYFELIK